MEAQWERHGEGGTVGERTTAVSVADGAWGRAARGAQQTQRAHGLLHRGGGSLLVSGAASRQLVVPHRCGTRLGAWC
jgi:hypothetical protein